MDADGDSRSVRRLRARRKTQSDYGRAETGRARSLFRLRRDRGHVVIRRLFTRRPTFAEVLVDRHRRQNDELERLVSAYRDHDEKVRRHG